MMISIVLALATVLTGLIAGVFFAFSCSVMRALGRRPHPEGMKMMRAINIAILNPIFLAVFVGSALLCVGVVGLGALNWQERGAGWAVSGAMVYLVGSFGVTIGCNVPRNYRLEQIDPESGESESFWRTYLIEWTRWNHVRTTCSIIATGLLIVAVMVR